MFVTKIDIDLLDPQSIERAIHILEQKAKEINAATDQMIRYLADFAVRYARNEYRGLPVDVHAEPIEGGYRIVAFGDLAVAAEFGVGITQKTEEQRGGSSSGYYIPEATITGLDELNIIRDPWARGGRSGNKRKKTEEEEEEEEAMLMLSDQVRTVMYRTAIATEAEIPNAARMFFGRS